jgi:hypothetical protein
MEDHSSIRRTPRKSARGFSRLDASSDDEEEEIILRRNKRRWEEQGDSSEAAETEAERADLFLVQDTLPTESKSLVDCCNIKSKPTAWAYHRFAFYRRHHPQGLAAEILQWDDKVGYALHGLLYQCIKGYTYPSDGECNMWNPRPLIMALLEFASSHCDPDSIMSMLLAECPHHCHKSHMGRTALHLACWGNVDMEIMTKLIQACPDALLAVDCRERTPADILQFYHLKKNYGPDEAHNQRRLELLERETDRLLLQQHRQLREEENDE